MPEIERIDESSDDVHVSAVSILTPDTEAAMGGKFEVYTLLVEAGRERYLVGFEGGTGGWKRFWTGDVDEAYEAASEEWMHDHYGNRIQSNERLDASDT